MGKGAAHSGWSQPWAVLSCIRKQAEQGSKQHSLSASASAPTSRFLPCLSSCPHCIWGWTVVWKCEWNKPFPPQAAFVSVKSEQHTQLRQTARAQKFVISLDNTARPFLQDFNLKTHLRYILIIFIKYRGFISSWKSHPFTGWSFKWDTSHMTDVANRFRTGWRDGQTQEECSCFFKWKLSPSKVFLVFYIAL